MSKKTVYSDTRLADFEPLLRLQFSADMAPDIYQDACAILREELQTMNDRGNRVIRRHLSRNILPGFACYKALVKRGIPPEQAVAFVKDGLCRSSQRMGNLCKWLGNKPFAYPLFRFFFGIVMKYGYPAAGWSVTWLERSKNRVRFDMHTCLYCEELEKRGALELCPAFCATDHAAYDPLAPGVRFIRKGTLAQGNKICDFCFERGCE